MSYCEAALSHSRRCRAESFEGFNRTKMLQCKLRLHIVSKFQVDRACLRGREATTDYDDKVE